MPTQCVVMSLYDCSLFTELVQKKSCDGMLLKINRNQQTVYYYYYYYYDSCFI